MSEKPVHVTRRACTEYSIRFDRFGWIVAHVSDATGVLSIASDWGSWSHRWNIDHLGYPTLTEFLIGRRDIHYIANKLVPRGREDVLDEKASKDEFKKAICEARRIRDLSRDDARDAWYEIEEWQANDHSLPCSEWLSEPYNYLVYADSSEYLALKDIVLPALLDAISSGIVASAASA